MATLSDYIGNGSRATPGTNAVYDLYNSIINLPNENNRGYEIVSSRNNPEERFRKVITKRPMRFDPNCITKMFQDVSEKYDSSGIESYVTSNPAVVSNVTNAPFKHRLYASVDGLTLDAWTPKGTFVWGWIPGKRKIKVRIKC